MKPQFANEIIYVLFLIFKELINVKNYVMGIISF